jgi:NAD(P)-dependent dehydrogenase (short-subunit alcohol dehydrogenase family)
MLGVILRNASSTGRMANLEKLGAILLPLDLTDDGSIVQAAERIRKEQGRIDVLVNNAGYGSGGNLSLRPFETTRSAGELVKRLQRIFRDVTRTFRIAG